MIIQRFRDLPLDNTIVPLHFVPDEVQLLDWLNALNALEPTSAAEKVLQVIGAFDQGDIKTSLKIKLLLTIYQYVPQLVKNIQKSYIDSSLPLSEQAAHDVELVVWIYMQLARGFRQCKLKYTVLGKEHQAGLLYISLEALNEALLHISLSYKTPMHGFWGLCYELYARAEQANLTHVEITWGGREDKNIAKIFKQLLIFHLCDTQQFRSRDMLMLFGCLGDFAGVARVLANYQTAWQSVVCVFNVNKDFPPQKINSSDPRDDLSERFITTVNVAKDMHQALQQQASGNNALRAINQEVMLRALNALGLARKRKYTRVFEKNALDGLVGLERLIEYLSDENTLRVIVPEAPRRPNVSAKSSVNQYEERFNLVPAGEELAHQRRDALKKVPQPNKQMDKLFKYADAASTSFTQQKEPLTQAPTVHKPEIELCKFEMQDSSAKGYGLITQLTSAQVRVGDLIAILASKSGRIEVGFIRRVNQMPKQYLHLGVEVIGFESELVFVSARQTPHQGCLAILLPGLKSLKQSDSLIFNSSLFKRGDEVVIRRMQGNQLYCLQRVVQMTLATSHIELLPLVN